MAITQAQFQNTLNLKGVFSLINGASSITDMSVWASLGVTSAKILLQIIDSTGQTNPPLYQNSGFTSANYSSPDLDVLGFPSVPVFNYTLPQDVNLQYLQGTYTINIAAQLISSFGIQDFSYTVYQNVCSCCNGVIANGTVNINYQNAQVSITDNTNYGNYISVANTLTLYPDPTTQLAPQSTTFNGTPATLIWQPASGQKTYTGNWKWTLSSILTYIDQQTGATTTCLVTGSGVFEVNQNPICKVLCYLNKYVTQVQVAQRQSISNAAAMERQLLQAQGYFALLLGQNDCGNNGEYYVEMIYSLIGVMNPNDGCCGCGNTNVQPLVPTQSINGTNGTNGLSFLIGTGAPGSGLGVTGDSYLDYSTWNIYAKTNSGWSLVGNIKGATGATGGNGQNGNNGAAVLYEDLTTSLTVGTTATICKTYPLGAGVVSANGSKISISTVVFTLGSGSTAYYNASVTIGGVQVCAFQLFANSNNSGFLVEADIIRDSATTAKIKYKAYPISSAIPFVQSGNTQFGLLTTDIAVNWSIENDIDVNVTSAGLSAGAECTQLEVVYYQFGTATISPTNYGTFANPAAALAGGVPHGGYYFTTATNALTILP